MNISYYKIWTGRTKVFALVVFVVCFFSCNKLVEVTPPNYEISSTSVYASDAAATSVLTGLYTTISSATLDAGIISTPLYSGLSGDELIVGANNPGLSMYYTNALNSTNVTPDYWSNLYSNTSIYTANAAIEGITASKTLTPVIKQQLLGEAKFMRAFYYFYLVNFFGDVPLVLSTDYKTNTLLARSAKADVYTQIIKDLTEAQSELNTNFLDGTLVNTSADRLRPSKWAATAFLARVYLYTNDYVNAEKQSSLLISNSGQFGLSSLPNTFLTAGSGNKEAIWQLQNTKINSNTEEGAYFIPPSPGSLQNVYLNNILVNAFETGDQRKMNWIGNQTLNGVTYYYAYKYKNNTGGTATEYETVFRLAEQYLIRAEAEANGAGTGLSGAVSDLNMIRNRAGLPNYTGTVDKPSLLTAILHERQVELFTEWGHRWFDLKRTGTIDAVMGVVASQKGGSWSSYKAFLPIPLTELKKDQNLTQNPSY